LIYNFISVNFPCFHVTTGAYSRGLSVCNLSQNSFLRIRSFVLFKRDVHVWVHFTVQRASTKRKVANTQLYLWHALSHPVPRQALSWLSVRSPAQPKLAST